MIPEGYTYETFIDFIQKEVFFEDPYVLGLGDLVPSKNSTSEELVFVNNGLDLIPVNAGVDVILNVLPSPFILEVNEEITLSNGVVLQIKEGKKSWEAWGTGAPFYGDTQIKARIIANPNGEYWRSGIVYSRAAEEAVERVLNPIFEKIMNDALRDMGLDGIEDVNSTNIYMFRQFAIVSALRTAMESMTSMYPVVGMGLEGVQAGGTEPQQIQFLYEVEKSRLEFLLSAIPAGAPTGFNIPDEINTSETTVKVVW